MYLSYMHSGNGRHLNIVHLNGSQILACSQTASKETVLFVGNLYKGNFTVQAIYLAQLGQEVCMLLQVPSYWNIVSNLGKLSVPSTLVHRLNLSCFPHHTLNSPFITI